jgi:hypothetical protein
MSLSPEFSQNCHPLIVVVVVLLLVVVLKDYRIPFTFLANIRLKFSFLSTVFIVRIESCSCMGFIARVNLVIMLVIKKET